MTRRTLIALLTSALCALSSLSCSYQHNNEYADDVGTSRGYKWKSLYREDIQTVAVPIFTNTTYYRDIEFALTKSIINQLEARSPYKVVDRSRADTILEGEIVAARVNTISEGATNAIPQEQLYTIRVNFTWKDLHTGKILTDRKNFEQTSAFYPTLGEGVFVGTQSAVDKLALGIVEELEADW